MKAQIEITQDDLTKVVTEHINFKTRSELDEYFNSLVEKLTVSKFIRVADKIINTNIIRDVSIIKEGDKE